MKIYRKGEKADDKWILTDTKLLAEFARAWHRDPEVPFEVNATYKPKRERNTVIGIEFDVEDMAALHGAFLQWHLKRIKELETSVSVLFEKVKRLELTNKKKPITFKKRPATPTE